MKPKKRSSNKIHQAEKSLSSTYRSFRDSDTSLFSLQNSGVEANGGAVPTKFHTLHSTTNLSRKGRAIHLEEQLAGPSSKSLTALDGSQCWSKEDSASEAPPEAIPVVSDRHNRAESPAGRRLLVYNCLRALGHGQWFNHWRKCQLLIPTAVPLPTGQRILSLFIFIFYYVLLNHDKYLTSCPLVSNERALYRHRDPDLKKKKTLSKYVTT